MTEWLKVVDCKSIEFSHHRFESYFLLFFVVKYFTKYSVVGSVPVLGTGGHGFDPHYFDFSLQII